MSNKDACPDVIRAIKNGPSFVLTAHELVEHDAYVDMAKKLFLVSLLSFSLLPLFYFIVQKLGCIFTFFRRSAL